MNKKQQTSGERTLKLNHETLRALTREQLEQANGGTTLHTSVCPVSLSLCG
jgi:hypothetical protein